MIQTILKIRTKQLFRLTAELGIGRSLFIIPLIGFVGFLIMLNIIDSPNPRIALLVTLMTISAIHLSRKDKHFLQIVNVNRIKLYFIEYFTICLPFIIAFGFSHIWYYSIALAAYIGLLSFLQFNFSILASISIIKLLIFPVPISFKPKKILKIPFIPVVEFEWISGLRTYLPGFIMIVIPSIIFCKYVAVLPVAIILLANIFSAFNLTAESRAMIEVYELPARSFFRMKLKNHLFFAGIIHFVFTVLFLIFNMEYWYVILFALIISISTQFFSIIIKYAFYVPNEDLGKNYIFIFLFQICFFILFLLPIPILVIIKYYNKATENLNSYLDAYN